MKMGWIILGIALIQGINFRSVYSQIPVEDPLEILDNLSDKAIESIGDQTDIQEELQDLLLHPLNLNSVTSGDLELLRILNPVEIQAILDYRVQHGPFIDLHELQVVEGLTLEKIRQIWPFVTVTTGSHPNAGSAQQYVQFRSTAYYPLREGFKNRIDKPAPYLGAPFSILLRYRHFASRKFSWGGSLETDAGESFNFKGKAGFDHIHFHYFKTGRPGKIKTIALGDYRISLGQGLLQYHGFAISKSSNPLWTKRVSPVIQAYSGTSEYLYFRGIATEIDILPGFKNYFFLHRRKRGATLRMNPDNKEEYFSTFQTSGLHRTLSEAKKRNNLSEAIAGHRIAWKKDLIHLGFNTIYQHFALPYRPIQRIDNLHRLTGSDLLSHSIDFSGSVQSLHFFGEIATQNYRMPAFTATGLYSFHPRLDGGILIRRFPAYFAPLYGNAFSARSIPNNESGIYVGLNYHISKGSILSFYMDSWKGLWPTFQAHGPTFDQDVFVRYEISRKRKWKAYGQFKLKHRSDQKSHAFPSYNTLFYKNQYNIRIQFRKESYQHWQWTNRLEWTTLHSFESHSEQGFLGFTDFLYRPIGSWWSAAFRLAYFNTDSYSSRIYAYESDVLYSFSIPSFYDRGWRATIKVRRKWRNGLSLELRTGWTMLPGAIKVGSGYNAVVGPFSQQSKMQIMYRF